MVGTQVTHDWRDVLLKAASELEQGWCQNALTLGTDDHRALAYDDQVIAAEATHWCVLGAMMRASHDLTGDIWSSAKFIAGDALRSYLGIDDEVGWNNAAGRTADEVAQALREAATR